MSVKQIHGYDEEQRTIIIKDIKDDADLIRIKMDRIACYPIVGSVEALIDKTLITEKIIFAQVNSLLDDYLRLHIDAS